MAHQELSTPRRQNSTRELGLHGDFRRPGTNERSVPSLVPENIRRMGSRTLTHTHHEHTYVIDLRPPQLPHLGQRHHLQLKTQGAQTKDLGGLLDCSLSFTSTSPLDSHHHPCSQPTASCPPPMDCPPEPSGASTGPHHSVYPNTLRINPEPSRLPQTTLGA